MYEYRCILVRAIDGDTVEVDVDLGFKINFRMHMRLYGINTPERGQLGFADATAYVEDWFITHPNIHVRTRKDKSDKYGRYLGEFYAVGDAHSLNYCLVRDGYAVEYMR